MRISTIVGLVLFLAAVVLVVLSTSQEEYGAKQTAMVQKYIDNANQALDEGDTTSAVKFVKMAIVVDPKSKEAFKTYEKAMELKYKPASDGMVESPAMEESPAQKEEAFEAAPDMGC